jgi:hypothetical protein
VLTRAHVYDHRKTLYALGKTALLEADVKDAEKSWLKLLSIEKDSDLAAQTHFAWRAFIASKARCQRRNVKCGNSRNCKM